MRQWTLAEAKRDCSRGLIVGASITCCSSGAYLVELKSKLAKEGAGYLLEGRSKKPREFAHISSALNTIKSIGLRPARLVVSTG